MTSGLGLSLSELSVSSGKVASVSINPAAQTWANAVIAAGGTVSAGRLTLVSNLINTLQSASIWTKFDRLWLFAAENSQSALRDIVAAAAATATGSPTFTTDRGYTGTDASSTVYIDSGFNASTAGGNFTQNSAHISMWSNTNAASTASGGVAIGLTTSGGQQSNILPKYSDGNAYFRVNDTSVGASAGVANANSTGHYLANRSGAAAQQGYRNAVDMGIVAVSSQALINGNMTILGQLSTPATHSLGDAHQNCGVSIGGSLTSGEVTSFYNALRTYMTAVGVP
jgi:hypothetical protein